MEQYTYLNHFSQNPNGTCYSFENLGKNVKHVIRYDLSIIVPCYNAEEYIETCASSILDQKTKFSFQVIFINDGSSDNTEGKLKKYQKTDNIWLISQKNGGFSAARNVGLTYASGKYIMFVDSDDVLMPNAIEKMLSCAFKYDLDIVQGNYLNFVDEKELMNISVDNCDSISIEDPVKKWPGYPWMKIYKNCLFKDVIFPDKYWFEDTIIVFLIYTRAKKVAQISNVVYGYRKNINSISHTFKKKEKTLDTFWVTVLVMNTLTEMNIEIDQKIYCRILEQMYINFCRMKYLPLRVQRKAYGEMGMMLKNIKSDTIKLDVKHKVLDLLLKNKMFYMMYLYMFFKRI